MDEPEKNQLENRLNQFTRQNKTRCLAMPAEEVLANDLTIPYLDIPLSHYSDQRDFSLS
jgi:hypothetical protein